MSSVLISAPAADIISTDDAKEWLRVDSSDEDALIDSLVAAAAGYMDGPEGILGRALVTQTWGVSLHQFPAGEVIYLPRPPVQSVTSVTYFDADNVEQTLSSASYRLIVKGDEAWIELIEGASWPNAYTRSDAVWVLGS